MNKKQLEAHQRKVATYKLIGCSAVAVVLVGFGFSHHSNANQQVTQDKAAVVALQQGIKDAKASQKKAASDKSDDSSKKMNTPSSSDQMKTATDFVLKYVQALPTINSEDVAKTINKTYLSDNAQLQVGDNIENDKNSFAVFGDKTDDLSATASLPSKGKIQVLVTSASVQNVVFTATYNTATNKIDATNTYGLNK